MKRLLPDDESSLIHNILKSLDDDQAQEILTIDLRGKTAFADYMVVASGCLIQQRVYQLQIISEDLGAR